MTGGIRAYWPLVLIALLIVVAPAAKPLLRGDPSAVTYLWLGLAIVAAMTLVVLGYLFVESRKAKTRPQEMETYSRRLGWSFEASGTSFDFAEWGTLRLFSATPLEAVTRDSRRAHNVIRGARDGYEIIVLDFSDELGMETVACLRSLSVKLPYFKLEPRAGADGPRELVFEGHPAFAKAYSVVGEDEPVIRSVFTPAVLDFFSTHQHLCVEGSGQRLVVFPCGVGEDLISPKRIPALIEQSLTIAQLFSSPGSRTNSTR